MSEPVKARLREWLARPRALELDPFNTTRPLIEDALRELEHKDSTLRELERGCRNAGLGYAFIYDTIRRGLR